MAGLPIVPIPFTTDHVFRRVPYVTYIIMGINVLVTLGIWAGVLGAAERDVDPGEYLSAVVHRWGFISNAPSPISLFTHAFMQVTPDHLIGNMLFLWLAGRTLEDGLGTWRFIAVYLSGMLGAALLFMAMTLAFFPNDAGNPMIGASGAIAAVMGLATIRYYRLRVRTLPMLLTCIPIPVLVWIPFWVYAGFFVANDLYSGIMSVMKSPLFNPFKGIPLQADNDHVAHWAHIGGYLLAVGAAAVMRSVLEGRRDYALQDASRVLAGEAHPKEKPLRELNKLQHELRQDPEVMDTMAQLALKNGDTDRARNLYIQSVKASLERRDAERAVISYLQLLYVCPTIVLDRREQFAIASALEALGHYPQAAQAFQIYIERYHSYPDVETALLRVAQIYQMQLGDFETARTYLRMLIDRFPHTSWYGLAQDRLREMGG